MTIKMEDLFGGEVDPDDISLDSDSRRELLYAAALAINAYDDNQIEISELKAMVGCYRKELRKIADLESVRQDECCWIAEQSLSALPSQCLADVKADAAATCARLVELCHDAADAVCILNDFKKELREQAK